MEDYDFMVARESMDFSLFHCPLFGSFSGENTEKYTVGTEKNKKQTKK